MKIKLQKQKDHQIDVFYGDEYLGKIFADGSFTPGEGVCLYKFYLDNIKVVTDNFWLFYNNLR